jgi:hypothetical protein
VREPGGDGDLAEQSRRGRGGIRPRSGRDDVDSVTGDDAAGAVAVTGHANIFAVLVCQDTRQLYAYLSEQIGALDGVQAVETTLVLRHIKQLALEPAG